MTTETSSTILAETTSSLNSTKILKQLEFYFSDANLPRDKFLLEQTTNDENGWVPLQVLSTFSRLRKMLSTKEETPEQYLSILKDTITSLLPLNSSIIEINDDISSIKRKTPLPNSPIDTLSLSIYVKGFPTTATLEEIESFCIEKLFDNVSDNLLAIRMRRIVDDPSKPFKGSVFVECKDKDIVDQILAKDFSSVSYPSMTQPLIVKSKMSYLEEKNEEYKRKKSSSSDSASSKTAKATLLRDKIGSGKLLKMKRPENSSSTNEPLTHEDIKKKFEELGFELCYVDFEYESGWIWIRFKESPIKFMESTKELSINEQSFTEFTHITEDSIEIEYYEKTMITNSNNNRNNSNNRQSKRRRTN